MENESNKNTPSKKQTPNDERQFQQNQNNQDQSQRENESINDENSDAGEEESNIQDQIQNNNNTISNKDQKQQDGEDSPKGSNMNQEDMLQIKKLIPAQSQSSGGRKCFNKLCTSKKIYKKIRSRVQHAKYRFLCKSCYDNYFKNCYCQFCEQIYSNNSDNDDQDLKWIGCDSCDRWNHIDCQKKYRDKNIRQRDKDIPYYCLTCTQKARSLGNDNEQYKVKATNKNGTQTIINKEDVIMAKRLKNRQLQISKQDRFLVFHKKSQSLQNLQGFLQGYNFKICINEGLIRQDIDNLRHLSSQAVAKRNAINSLGDQQRNRTAKRVKISD